MSTPRAPLVSRLTVGRWFALAAGLLALVTAIGAVVGAIAIERLTDARAVVLDRNGPVVRAAMDLSRALLDEETGVRGLALGGREDFLAPYRTGRAAERKALAQLDELTHDPAFAQTRRDTARVRARAEAWRRDYATPTIADVRVHGPGSRTQPSPAVGRRAFSAVRAALGRQSATLDEVRLAGRKDLSDNAAFLTGAFVAIVILIAIGILAAVIALRFTVTAPLRRLGRGVRRIAQGDFQHAVEGHGPHDVVALTADVDSMRRRIVEELSKLQEAHARLDAQTHELQRSNAELEQFAYVASHDLQEPLRKVASFCQLLEQRYEAELDERGREYLRFAADGAKRMQQLINDLLAFSRVGRGDMPRPAVACDAVLQDALQSLAAAIEEHDAEVVAGPLPTVRAEPALLAAVFQNLVGNALKFHGDGRPRVEISAEREDGRWLFTCADDGIGIEPDYAERIFMIFQRLHPKDVYAGTGIGLALCRKIVEYHGGRIWLDTESAGRTTFRFTLPALEETA